MICPIVTSPVLLQIPSSDATPADASVGQNLLDTLAAHSHECVGMAANMIGVHKRIIVVKDGDQARLMYNPEIQQTSKPYDTKEGCLSLTGVHETTRYQRIKLAYLDESFQPQIKIFTGFTAQIIQHEIDHCNGILI